MRAFALLLLGAVAGFAVGRLTAWEERGRGGERRAAPPEVLAAPRPDETPVAKPEPSSPRSENAATVDPGPEDGVVLPTRPRGADEECEYLAVDFAGFPGKHAAYLARRKIRGELEETAGDAGDDDIAWIRVPPGTYDVWWFDEQGRRLGVRARIDEGNVTMLRAVDHTDPAPVPKGFGALQVEVTAICGGGLAGEHVCIMRDEGDWQDIGDTDARGHVNAILVPGDYRVNVGWHESHVVVGEGRATLHRIDHRSAGDLVLVSEREAYVTVTRGEYGWSNTVEAGTESFLPYLPEGEYEIAVDHLSRIGRAVVHAGRTTRFVCEPPTGGILVRLTIADKSDEERATVNVRRGIDGRESNWGIRSDLNLTLAPGRYVVTASLKGYGPASATVDVADKVVDLSFELTRTEQVPER